MKTKKVLNIIAPKYDQKRHHIKNTKVGAWALDSSYLFVSKVYIVF